MIANVPPFRFTVDQYHRMIDVGILSEDDRVELIRGQVVPKMPIGSRHIRCVNVLTKVLARLTGADIEVSVQNPVTLPDSEPEPDLALLRARSRPAAVKPLPQDVILLVEVADSSIDRNRDDKGPLYAENAVPEYWIVNLDDDTVHVFRGPQPDGTWASHEQRSRSAALTVAALPGVAIPVADILP